MQLFRFIITILAFLVVVNVCPATDYPLITSTSDKIVISADWQIARDPDPKGALQNIADSLWEPFSHYENYYKGNWLFRTEITVIDSSIYNQVMGLFARFFITAVEIYWDGDLIKRNGIIGISREDEEPGAMNCELTLPFELLKPGKHTVMLRVSNYHDYTKWKWFNGQLRIEPYTAEVKKRVYQDSYILFFTAGNMLVPFLFFLFLFIIRKGGAEYFLFCLVCFFIIIEHTVWHIQYFLDLKSTYTYWIMYALRISSVLRSIVFPIFLLYYFLVPRKKLLITLIVLCNTGYALFIADFWNLTDAMNITLLVQNIILSLWAALKKRDGSYIILLGNILAWLALATSFQYLGTGSILVVFTSLSMAKQFVKKENAEREAKLRSAILENELLRKNVSPHFLLNSLTSVIAWLRKDPKKAIHFIEALANEFRIINQVSALKEISVRQEIDLCRAHLEIMSFRRGGNYELKTENINPDENIPPMIFHTLVENGLSHGFEARKNGVFTIRKNNYPKSIQYVISHDGSNGNGSAEKSSGFGMRYIKARLEESYPNRWKMMSDKAEQGWMTVIEIGNK
ncbi:MAG: histidine kinase [Bacteroidetes bacterium]|nr:histidine kinase [Bacteroidota bacterium]